MQTLVLIGVLFIGIAAGVAFVFILQQERVVTAGKHLAKLGDSITQLIRKRNEMVSRQSKINAEIQELKQSTMRLINERDQIEMAWRQETVSLQSTNRVVVDEAIVFGRGREWVYLYTFPVHEHLAHERRQKNYPMKIGMSTQDDVVTRVHQQVSGNSTAISERAIIRLIFRVNDSRDVERWMHEHLHRINRRVSDSVGVEWFNTNPLEIEQLFRSYVLQQIRSTAPAIVTEFA